MTGRLSPETPVPRPTPRDMADAIARRRGIGLAEHLETTATPTEHAAGDIIERDGKRYMLVPELRMAEKWEDGKRVFQQHPYKYAEYYAHTFPEPGTNLWVPGPGWDSHFRLYDPAIAVAVHDRTFSTEELRDFPANLPDVDCLFVSDLEGGRVAEYLEYLEPISKPLPQHNKDTSQMYEANEVGELVFVSGHQLSVAL